MSDTDFKTPRPRVTRDNQGVIWEYRGGVWVSTNDTSTYSTYAGTKEEES